MDGERMDDEDRKRRERQENERRIKKNRSDLTRTLLKGGRKKSAVWRLLLYEEVRVLRLGINWSGGAKTGDGLGATGLLGEGQSGSGALACRYLARMYCCTLDAPGDTSRGR